MKVEMKDAPRRWLFSGTQTLFGFVVSIAPRTVDENCLLL